MTETMRLLPPIARERGIVAKLWDLLVVGSLRPMPRDTAKLRRAYAVDLWTTQVPVSLHHAIIVIGLINLAFIAADWWTFSEKFIYCLPARLLLTTALIFLWNPRSPSERLLAGLLLYSFTGLMIIWVIIAAGGTASEYSPGLVLLLAGIPILLPVSALQASLVVGLLLAIYSFIPFVDPDPSSPRQLVLHLSFPWAAAFGALIACHRLDSVRFADYCKRHALEVAGEKLQALDQAKSRFIANVNHELRTPLTLLLLPTDELLSTHGDQLTPTQRECVEIIRSNAGRLLSLVNNVLTAAAFTSGGIELQRRPIEIQSIVEMTLGDIRTAAARNGLEVRAEGLESAGTVFGDSDALQRVLLNVLDNAVKCTPPGGRIDVRVASSGDGIEISTEDNGIGLRKEDVDRIFERFVQLDDGPRRRNGGIGLGLGIARDLVELHGGRIWAESDGVGKGAAIRIWLPRGNMMAWTASPASPADSERRASPDATLRASDFGYRCDDGGGLSARGDLEDAGQPRRGVHKVLVVDDSPEMRVVLARLLSREFHVRTAASGSEALRQILEETPDLVLADIMMEGLSGIELCRLLKKDGATRGIPVILVTALADQDSKINGLEIGAEDYVAKPFRARELTARIRGLLQLRSVQRDLIARNEALEEAIDALNASKKRVELYSRAVSHDLRGPLAAAGAAVKAALRATPRDIGETLEIAAENLSRADRMLVALRSFARTVSAPEESDEIDLRTLVEDVVAGVAVARGGRPLPIRTHVDRTRVRGRAEKLGHVFRNLIDNALRSLESSPAGEIIVEGRQDGSRAIVHVVDNGCGIPSEMQQAIFEPFQRGPCSKPGNLGLGLALARQIVEEHGGDIQVASRLGQGSTFTVTLPASMEQNLNG